MTNVPRLGRCVARIDDRIQEDQTVQYWVYQPGIGSDIESADSGRALNISRLLNKTRNLARGAVGAGIDRNILVAYQFLCERYVSPAATHIILVGCSRGAFTARVPAVLLSDMGVLSDRGLKRLPAIFKCWKAQRSRHKDLANRSARDAKEAERLVRQEVRRKFPKPEYHKCQDVADQGGRCLGHGPGTRAQTSHPGEIQA